MKYKNIRKHKNIFVAFSLLILIGFGLYSYRSDKDIEDGENQNSLTSPLLVIGPKVKYQVSSSTPQFVLFSFDGSKSVNMLNDTLDFERTMSLNGKPLHFTYFINAAYFLTPDNAKLYQAPGQSAGISNINFSSTTADIAVRIRTFNTAYNLGNEIGSHTVGHFDGSRWSYDDWKKEFVSFDVLMRNVQENNLPTPIDSPVFLDSIKGFRAPDLGVNDNLYKVLSEFHFTYDTSGVARVDTWPRKDSYGIWHIPLAEITVGKGHQVLSMDYNFFKLQSNVKEKAVKGTPLWDTFFDQMFNAYTDYFNTNYNGNRAPIIIAGHFSKWNDGVYWEVMKKFADSVCGRPEVKCVTYKELVDYLDTVGVPAIVK